MVALLLLLAWHRNPGELDPRALAWVIATPLALFAGHRLVPRLLPWLLAAEGLQKTAVIAGANGLARNLGAHLRARPFLGIRYTGYFDDRSRSRDGDAGQGENLGDLGHLVEYVKQHHIDIIYITLPMTSQPRILTLLEELRDTTASVYFAPDILLYDLIQARVETIGGLPVLAVCESPFYGVDGLIKRVSDIVLASTILVLIAPLMLAITIAVKLTSPGAALFKQRRYGLDGREILVTNSRTDALEDGAVMARRQLGDRRGPRSGAS